MKKYLLGVLCIVVAGCSSGPSVANEEQLKGDLVGQTFETDIAQRREWTVAAGEVKELVLDQRFTDKKAGTDEVHVSVTLNDGVATAKGKLTLGYKKYDQGWRLEQFVGALQGSGQYIDKDGTVTDNYKKLMWVKDFESPGCTNNKFVTWPQAVKFCENLSYAGYSDWRLPEVKEAASIVYGSEIDPKSQIRRLGGIVYWTADEKDDQAGVIRYYPSPRTAPYIKRGADADVCCVRSVQ